MPLVRINALGERIALADSPAPVAAHLGHVLRRVPRDAPVVILIHGFKFSPDCPRNNPHEHILSLQPTIESWKVVSWPKALGFSGTNPADGLCIAFGWDSLGSIWRAYAEAARAGRALADLIQMIRRLRPGQGVDIVSHSLGARVTLSALPHLPAGALRRAILMTPAEVRSAADPALNTPAGRSAQFLNITSRENDFYDCLLEWMVAPHRLGDRALSHSAGPARANWLDLQIDHDDVLTALAHQGHHIARPKRRVCHWSPYLRPGMLAFYRRLLREDISLSELRAALPDAPSRRWSRLFAPPRLPRPLPFLGNAPS